MESRYDIVIAGAGMVGATLACALGARDLKVALVDPAPLPHREPLGDFELRVSAITRASEAVLQALDVWQRMPATRPSPFTRMRVWDAAGSGTVEFDSADIGEARLGHIVENRLIQDAALDRCLGLETVDLISGSAVDHLEVHERGVVVELDNGPKIMASTLVGADGADSRIRRLAKLAVRGRSYAQRAVVATVRPQRDHQQTAWQRFLPEGPLAFLPLPEGHCSIVWSTGPERADELLAMDETAFRQNLGDAFEMMLGPIEWTSPRAAFELRWQHAPDYVCERVALVGDAAHTIHPLAGQGVNLGIMDAAALAEILTDARDHGRDPGQRSVLRRYERWRKGENLLMLSAMDAFNRLFGARAQPVRWVRNWGLRVFDAADPLKHVVMRRAMGLSGDLPALARRAEGS